MLLSDYPFFHAATTPSRTAVVFRNQRWSYAELAQHIERWARALYAAGIRRGDRIALLSPPRPEFLMLYMAAGRIGAVFVGLNPRHTLAEHLSLLQDCSPKILFGLTSFEAVEFSPLLNELSARVASIETLLLLPAWEDAGREEVSTFLARAQEVDQAEFERCIASITPTDPLCIVYTSGSTGRRKGAVLTHGNFVSVYTEAVRQWSVSAIRQIHNYPIDHIGGLGDVTAYVLIGGGTQVFMERFEPVASLNVIRSERITVWGQEVAMFQRIVSTPEFDPATLTSVELIWWAGAAAPNHLIEELGRLRARLSTCWGMSETCGPVTFSRPDAPPEELAGTVGIPGAACEIRVMDEEGKPCGPNTTGEVWVRGPCVMMGYTNCEHGLVDAREPGGWFRSGDLGHIQDEGNLALVGRQREMIKSGGYNIYPREIEIVIERHPKVQLTAVIGIPDPIYQQVSVAFVQTPEPELLSAEDLKAHCKAFLANYKIPKLFIVGSDLPRLSNGKVDRAAMKAEAEQVTREVEPAASCSLRNNSDN